MKRESTKAKENQILEAYNNGLTVPRISKMMDLSTAYIYKVLRENGVVFSDRKGKCKREIVNDTYENLGRILRERRHYDLKMTQGEMASALNLSTQKINFIEDGKFNIGLKLFFDIARAYELNAFDLLYKLGYH